MLEIKNGDVSPIENLGNTRRDNAISQAEDSNDPPRMAVYSFTSNLNTRTRIRSRSPHLLDHLFLPTQPQQPTTSTTETTYSRQRNGQRPPCICNFSLETVRKLSLIRSASVPYHVLYFKQNIFTLFRIRIYRLKLLYLDL